MLYSEVKMNALDCTRLRKLLALSCLFLPLVGFAQDDTKTIDRPGFTMQYPADWVLADKQSDFDADRFFTIDTDGRSSITIEIFPAVEGQDPDDLLFNAIYVLDGPLVDTYSRSNFSKWGRLQGEGTHLKGKVMSLFPGGARIFFAQEGGKGIMITEIYYAEDVENGVAEGFEFIGNNFYFK